MDCVLPGRLACPWTQDFEFIEYIGEGHVGQVYRAADVAGQVTRGRNSNDVVVKFYKGSKGKSKFKKEVEMMRRVQGHTNAVSLLASHSDSTKGIIMPFYGEVDLHAYVWNCDGLPEIQAKGVTRDLLSALNHIHGCGIIHRDVKPENMILGQDGRAVLLDFDVACDATDTLACAGLSGSPGYCAPEVLLGDRASFSSDIFSVGCVVYFMFAKVHPFVKKKEATVDDIVDATKECDVKFGRRFGNVSRDCLKFILSTAVRCTKRRLSEQRASTHPWLAEEETGEDLTLEPMAHEESVHTSQDGSLLNAKPSLLFDRVCSSPVAKNADSKSRTQSRVSKLKLVGRDVFGKMSRALGSMRRRSTTVTRLGNRSEECQEDLSSMAGILIRD